MNDEALLNTVPERYYFKTGSVAPSNNTFTLSATDITARGATVAVEPTNDDSYVAMLTTADRFAGQSDKEITDYITSSLSLNYNSGAMSQVVDGLSPNTEYQLLVFGCEAGVATTGLSKLNFTTKTETYANLNFEIRIGDYYDANEVAELYPHWSAYAGSNAIVMPEVVVDEAADRFYYTALKIGAYNSMTEEEIIQGLLSEEPAVGDEVMVIPYDFQMVFVGFAVDGEGLFTKLWVGKPITFTKEGSAPVEGFVDPATPIEAPAAAAAKEGARTLGGLMLLN
jgi:hypothetical protein